MLPACRTYIYEHLLRLHLLTPNSTPPLVLHQPPPPPHDVANATIVTLCIQKVVRRGAGDHNNNSTRISPGHNKGGGESGPPHNTLSFNAYNIWIATKHLYVCNMSCTCRTGHCIVFSDLLHYNVAPVV